MQCDVTRCITCILTSRQGTELQKFYQVIYLEIPRSHIVISSDLCNAIKKILDKFSFHRHFKGTVSPAERCDFVSVKLEKVNELFPSLSYLWERSGVL